MSRQSKTLAVKASFPSSAFASASSSKRGARSSCAATWPLVLLTWLVLLLFELSFLIFFEAMPWAGGLTWWTVPATLGAGIALGVLLVLASRSARWWWIPIPPAIFLAAAVILGSALAYVGITDARSGLIGPLLFGALGCVLPTLLPWLIFRGQQVWPALIFCWLLLAGAWSMQAAAIHDHEAWWLCWLLVLSLLLVGLQRMRLEMEVWQHLKLQRIGAVGRQSFRAVVLVTLLVALVALVPVNLASIPALSQLWQRAPFAHGGALPYRGDTGMPVAVLGAPLSVNAQSVNSHQVLYTYQFISGTPQQTPLLGDTFDTFDGTTWTQQPVAATLPAGDALAFPSDAQLLRARITVASAPDIGTTPLLVGFSQPISFSIPAQVRVLANGPPTPVTVADWRTVVPLAKGTTYDVYSAVLTDDVRPVGSLSPALVAGMTALPAPLAATLRATAQQWLAAASPTGTSSSPAAPSASVQQARALLAALKAHVQLDPAALPPSGADAVTWALAGGRANGLLLTTLYILLGRAIGLPLRLAEGYLPGTYDSQQRDLVVRASDGTVWAQLAIPGKGWLDILTVVHDQIVLVPRSAKQPPLATPAPAQAPSSPFQLPILPGLGSLGSDLPGIAWGLAALLLLLILLAASLAVLRWSRLGRRLNPVGQFFVRLAVLARLGGIPLRPSDTAAQGTAEVAAHLPTEQARVLTGLNGIYERVSYGPSPGQMSQPSRELRQQWRQMRGALVRLIITRPWRRKRPTLSPNPTPTTKKGRQPG